MEVTEFLRLLDGVRETGQRSWIARCPGHDDHEPSLSIKRERDRILVYCHAGCTTEKVVGALGVTMSDLFDSNKHSTASAILALYDYRDEHGDLLFQVVRTEPRGFYQRRPDGCGGWVNDLKGVRRVLYRLPELEAHLDEIVFFVEGEKDADRLAALGLLSTTNSGGAGQWRKEYSEVLRGRIVVIIADNDESGRNHAEQVLTNLREVGCSAFVVSLPDVPEKGDVSDYLDAGHDEGDLWGLVRRTYEKSRPGVLEDVPGHYSDLGNAERLVRLHGDDLRYCHDRKEWLWWDGARWAVDNSEEVVRRAKDTIRSMYEEAAQQGGLGRRSDLADHALRSAGGYRIRSMVALAQSERGIPIQVRELDSDPWKLNVLNGTLDLKTGRLRCHSRADLHTRLAPVEYDPRAACPQWDAFLHRVLGEDDELGSFVQRVAGYTLTGNTDEQVLFFLYGKGANGKSTFLAVLHELLGEYARTASFDTFIQKQRSGATNDIARLAGARYVTAQEAEGGAHLSEAMLKQVTGGDTVAARFLYAEHFEFTPSFKLYLAANHKPVIRGTDCAIWRRIRLIPFTVTIPEKEQDKDLVRKLKQELPGILAWAVRGCFDWQRSGLGDPPAVTEATDEYRQESDALGSFLAECCAIARNAHAPASGLYSAYENWGERNGEQLVSKKAFGMELGERGFTRRKTSGRNHWEGVGLLPRDDGDDQDRFPEVPK